MKSQYYTVQLILSACLLLLSFQLHAQQWYHVELIVFEQLNTITDEQWPQMTEFSNSELSSDAETSLVQPTTESLTNSETELLPDMETPLIQPTVTESLNNAASRLSRSSRYQVHYHNAWQQPIMTKRRAKAIKIHSGNDLIEGNIRLYKATYLHAALDLWLKQNTDPISPINSWSDFSPEGEVIEAPRNPNLEESRRVRAKKLYFFDHPKMGALLQLTPIETPEAVRVDLEQLETYSLPTEAESTVSE
jgi:peptidoglycan-binding protein CsiV